MERLSGGQQVFGSLKELRRTYPREHIFAKVTMNDRGVGIKEVEVIAHGEERKRVFDQAEAWIRANPDNMVALIDTSPKRRGLSRGVVIDPRFYTPSFSEQD